MKRINEYISEKLIVNNTIQDNISIQKIFEVFLNIIKTNNINLGDMSGIDKLCTMFNKHNNLGLHAICIEWYLKADKNQYNLDIPPQIPGHNRSPEVIKKYGNVFIVDDKSDTLEYFIRITENMQYLQKNINDFVDNGYIFGYNRNYKKFKLDPIKLYTKQDILDLF